MTGDRALKEEQAHALRRELSGLRASHTIGLQSQSGDAQDAKLDTEIEALQRQIALERERASSGGSIIDAMEAMEAAAAAEAEEVESASLAIVPPAAIDKEEAATVTPSLGILLAPKGDAN